MQRSSRPRVFWNTGKATAESEALLNEARNKLSPAIIEFEITRERIRIVPAALAEAVKPIEKISDIRIFDTGGMLGRNGNGANGGSGVGLGEGLAGQLLSYQANKPILDRLLKEAGFDGDNAISALLGNLDGKSAVVQSNDNYDGDTEETDKPV